MNSGYYNASIFSTNETKCIDDLGWFESGGRRSDLGVIVGILVFVTLLALKSFIKAIPTLPKHFPTIALVHFISPLVHFRTKQPTTEPIVRIVNRETAEMVLKDTSRFSRSLANSHLAHHFLLQNPFTTDDAKFRAMFVKALAPTLRMTKNQVRMSVQFVFDEEIKRWSSSSPSTFNMQHTTMESCAKEFSSPSHRDLVAITDSPLKANLKPVPTHSIFPAHQTEALMIPLIERLVIHWTLSTFCNISPHSARLHLHPTAPRQISRLWQQSKKNTSYANSKQFGCLYLFDKVLAAQTTTSSAAQTFLQYADTIGPSKMSVDNVARVAETMEGQGMGNLFSRQLPDPATGDQYGASILDDLHGIIKLFYRASPPPRHSDGEIAHADSTPQSTPENQPLNPPPVLQPLNPPPVLQPLNPWNIILPTYETLWRLVAVTCLEIYRRPKILAQLRFSSETRPSEAFLTAESQTPSNSHQFTSTNNVPDQFDLLLKCVRQSLLVYPPTRHIHRVVVANDCPWPKDTRLAIDVGKLHHMPTTWSVDDPMTGTASDDTNNAERRSDLLCDCDFSFGFGSMKCPAAANFAPTVAATFVGIFVNTFSLVGSADDDSHIQSAEPLPLLDCSREALEARLNSVHLTCAKLFE